MGEDCHPRPCRSAAAVAVGIGGAASLVVAAGALSASPKALWCADCVKLTPRHASAIQHAACPLRRWGAPPAGSWACRSDRPSVPAWRRSSSAACPCLPGCPSSPPWRSRPSAARVARCPTLCFQAECELAKNMGIMPVELANDIVFCQAAAGKRPGELAKRTAVCQSHLAKRTAVCQSHLAKCTAVCQSQLA